jgi:uncharacterized protein (TIGR02453 family)
MTIIQPSTLEFLIDLSIHNNRDWFAENKPRYEIVKANFKGFGNALLEEMNKIDHIDQLKFHRIYRDVRFSKDKTPYQNKVSCSLSRATKLLRGGYYLHIEPGNSFLGGGFWAPSPSDLARIRQEIAFDAQSLRAIINHENFKNTFGELEGDKVKTAPRGYAKDHEAVDLLRYKQFLLSQIFTDEEVLNAAFLGSVVKGFQAMRPFFDYMSDVLTTDENGVLLV